MITVSVATFLVSMFGWFMVGFLIAVFASRGIVFTFLRSVGGSKIICMIDSETDTYLRVGKLNGEWLTFKDRSKEVRRLRLTEDHVTYMLKRFWVRIDENSNAVATPDWKVRRKDPTDARQTDHLFRRALYTPHIETPRDKIIFWALIVLLALTAFGVYKLFGISGSLEALKAAASSTVGGMNV